MKIVIIGAGITGLTIAHFLSQRSDFDITILEKENQIGGLAKTIKFDDLIFDSGPHRFHTKNTKILKIFFQVMNKEKILQKNKVSSIYFQNRLLNYPLKIRDIIWKLKGTDSITSFLSYFYYKIKKHTLKPNIKNFEDFIVYNFGKKLNEIYFKPYTEKMWQLPEKSISVDWAKTRIPLASFYDLFIKTFRFSLKKTFYDAHSHSPYESNFYYPANGIGKLSENLLTPNINLVKNFQVKNIRKSKDSIISVDSTERSIVGDIFIFSNPINEISEMILNYKARNLSFLTDKLMLLPIEKKKISNDHSTYFPQKNIIFNRITEMKNFTNTYPKDRTSLIVEYGNNDISPLNSYKTIIRQLIDHSIIKPNDIKLNNFKIVTLNHAYPIFSINYREEKDFIFKKLKAFKNFYLSGRNGTFAYINMDEAILNGKTIADKILKKYRSS